MISLIPVFCWLKIIKKKDWAQLRGVHKMISDQNKMTTLKTALLGKIVAQKLRGQDLHRIERVGNKMWRSMCFVKLLEKFTLRLIAF